MKVLEAGVSLIGPFRKKKGGEGSGDSHIEHFSSLTSTLDSSRGQPGAVKDPGNSKFSPLFTAFQLKLRLC